MSTKKLASKITPRQRDDWMRAVLASPLTAACKVSLCRIALHLSFTTGRIDPSFDGLAERTGQSRRAVIKHVEIGVAAGWLRRTGTRGRHRNNYELNIPQSGCGNDIPDSERRCTVREVSTVNGTAPLTVHDGAPFDDDQQCTAEQPTVHGGAPQQCTGASATVHRGAPEERCRRSKEEERGEDRCSARESKAPSDLFREDAAGSSEEVKGTGTTRTPESTAPSRRSRRRPARPIPDDFEPDLIFAEQNGLNGLQEFERFKDHALTNDRHCASWPAAWRNWVRRGVDMAKRYGNGAHAGQIIDEFGNPIEGPPPRRTRGRTHLEIALEMNRREMGGGDE